VEEGGLETRRRRQTTDGTLSFLFDEFSLYLLTPTHKPSFTHERVFNHTTMLDSFSSLCLKSP